MTAAAGGPYRLRPMSEPAPAPLRKLGGLLWKIPLLALPFALFFGTLFGEGGLRRYVIAYELALTFSGVIGLSLWLLECFLLPALRRRLPAWQPTTLGIGLLYMVSSIAASFLAALVVQTVLLPGFMGTGRSLAVFGMFALLFSTLFTAVALVVEYHRSSIVHARAEKELELARTIQRTFLPESFPSSPRVEVHAVNVPSKQVSGDFYDVVPAGKGLLLAIADVEGKSVPAALLVAALQASLRTQTATTPSVSDIVRNINTLVCQRAGAQQFATFFLARVEEDGRRLTYCNAGHNPPVLFRASGARQLLQRGGLMFGVLEAAPFDEEAVELGPGDRVLFYTDGITEATAPGGEEYGPERLASLVAALPPALSAREVTARVLQELHTFSHGADPADDQTLVVLRVSA